MKSFIKEAASEALREEERKQSGYKISLNENIEECIKRKKKLDSKWLSTESRDDLV